MLTKNSVIAIVGPTGAGKTRLAIKLAQKIKNLKAFDSAEIICCDSRQIYLDMNIATAKPSKEETELIPHHLYDFMPPDISDYSVAVFVEQAQAKINELIYENKLPIVVGGTGLYFKSLLGEFDIPKVAPNYELREKLNKKWSSKANYYWEIYKSFSFVHCESTTEILGTLRDKKDIPVLSDAIFHNIDILLTGDKDFLESGIKRPKMLSPTILIEYLQQRH